MLLLDTCIKVMTFVLYPLFSFQESVKDWNATELSALEVVIVTSMQDELKMKIK